MNRPSLICLILFTALNTGGIVYLTADRLTQAPAARPAKQLTPPELEQLTKLFELAVEFRTELEQLAGRAEYPTDKEKSNSNKYLQDHLLTLNFARLELERVQRERTRRAAEEFIALCWGDQNFLSRGTALVEVEKYRFGKWSQRLDDYVSYPGVNFSKLESLNNEFRVLALSFVKDIK